MTEKIQQLGFFPDPDALTARPERLGKIGIEYQESGSILNKASGFLQGYDYSLNPYSGCSYGCSYCYAISFANRENAEETWGKWVVVKENAIKLMRKYRPGVLDGKRIYMSSVTDPYQTVERRTELTRGVLKSLSENHKPLLVVQTRSPDVTRDIDIFGEIERRGGRVQVNMTITTDDDELRRVFEPTCPSNGARLKAIQEVQQSGIQSCITMTPLLLVKDKESFADTLLETGVRNFIIQDFHPTQGAFIASTRQQAWDLMAERLNCSVDDVATEHAKRYRVVRDHLKAKLPRLGEGKSGFSPPF